MAKQSAAIEENDIDGREDRFPGIICVCWVAGTLVGFLPLFGWNVGMERHKNGDHRCIFTNVMDYNYLVFLYFATIIFPALLIAAFYAHIYRVIVKQVSRARVR